MIEEGVGKVCVCVCVCVCVGYLLWMRGVGMQRAMGRISTEYQGQQFGFYSQHKGKTLKDYK